MSILLSQKWIWICLMGRHLLIFSRMNYSFGKEEKLKSRKQIQRLFAEGETIVRYPVKLVYLKSSAEKLHQVAVSVPKRNFKKATDRNRLKRLLRESYRLNKQQLPVKSRGYFLMFIYLGKDFYTFDRIQNSVITLLNELDKKSII